MKSLLPRYWMAACLTYLLAVSWCLGQEPDLTTFDALIEKARTDHDAPGLAVAVVHKDKIVYLKGFGVRSLGKEDAVTPDTIFAIASCTKAFTAMGAAFLVDEGKLAWDDPAGKHLDFYRLADPLADREATIRDLLCHRTGMPRHDWLWLGSEWSQEELIRRYGRAKPSTSFRSKWEYANIPFTTVGYLTGKLAGTSWAEVMKSRIFTPLGMSSANCSGKETRAQQDVAQPHYVDAAFKLCNDEWDERDNAASTGAGAINASARDMAQWLRFQLGDGSFNGKRLLQKSTFQELQTAQAVVRREGRWKVLYPDTATEQLAYGLGWFVHDHRGKLALSHGGTLSGFRAHVMLVPKKKLGVVVLVNRGGTFLPEALAKTLSDKMLGMNDDNWLGYYLSHQKSEQFNKAVAAKLRKPKPDTKPSRELDAYVGVYEEPAYGTLEIRREGEGLQLSWASCQARLEHFNYDTFSAKIVAPAALQKRIGGVASDVVFRLDAKGNVESVLFLEQEFTRKKKPSP